jgi:hypothetical protein
MAVPVPIVPRVHAWMKPAAPFPWIDVCRAAGPARDRSYMDVMLSVLIGECKSGQQKGLGCRATRS